MIYKTLIIFFLMSQLLLESCTFYIKSNFAKSFCIKKNTFSSSVKHSMIEAEKPFNYPYLYSHKNTSFIRDLGVSKIETLKEEEFDLRNRDDGYKLTTPKEHPSAVLLARLDKNGNIISTCSGSLLTEKWVLTAAHCMKPNNSFLVYAGGSNLLELVAYTFDGSSLPAGSQALPSLKALPHPLYIPLGIYDVGLVEVKGKFNLSDTVKTIPLSTVPWTPLDTYVKCETTAFGKVEGTVPNINDNVRKTHQFEVIRPCVCSSSVYGLFKGNAAYHLLCHKPTKDLGVCSGDSGGGLICDGKLKALNKGALQFDDISRCTILDTDRIECGLNKSLSVFQDICPALQWISENVDIFNKEQINDCITYQINADLSSAPYCLCSNWILIFIVILQILNICYF